MHTETYQESPDPSFPCVILKAIRTGVGWVWLARLAKIILRLFSKLACADTAPHRGGCLGVVLVFQGLCTVMNGKTCQVYTRQSWCDFTLQCSHSTTTAPMFWTPRCIHVMFYWWGLIHPLGWSHAFLLANDGASFWTVITPCLPRLTLSSHQW